MGKHLNDHLMARQADALKRNTLPVGEAYLTFLYLQRLSNTLATRIPHLQGEERVAMLERYHETLAQVELAQVALASAQQAASQAILADGAEVARQHMTDLLVEIGVVPGLGYDKTRVLLDELVEAVTAVLAEVTA
jgi:hypothetical protein